MARILVIDDKESIREALVKLLEREGHEIELAENGKIGLDKFQESPFDLVITDIVMPDKEGIETIKDLRSLSPDVKIIAISGGGRTGNYGFLSVALKVGANSALPKPFKRAHFLHIVSDCLQEISVSTDATAFPVRQGGRVDVKRINIKGQGDGRNDAFHLQSWAQQTPPESQAAVLCATSTEGRRSARPWSHPRRAR